MASKYPEDDPMTGGESIGLKTFLTIQEVLELHKQWNYPKPSMFAMKLIREANWSIANLEYSDENEKNMTRLKDLVLSRWYKLLKNWKDARHCWKSAPMKSKDPNSTFIDLMPDFQSLINYDAIPKFGGSQNSNSSASKKSWVEEEVSGSKMRKDFEDMVPRHQRRLTEDIYDSITNAASDLNLDVDDLLLYLAMRSCYHKDRKKKMAFEAIKDGSYKEKQEFPIEKAVCLKSQLWLSSREWIEIRLAMKNYVKLPTKDEIRKYQQSIFHPQQFPFRFGIRIDLPQIVAATLERLPSHVVAQLPSEVVAMFNGGKYSRVSNKLAGRNKHACGNNLQFL